MSQRRTAVLAAGFVLVGCAEPAPVPKFPVGGDPGARAAAYADYELHADIGAFSATWKRKDGEYGWGQLGDVAKQFPESSDVYDRANTRGLVLGTIGGVGGGIVGYTLGWNLTASEDKR